MSSSGFPYESAREAKRKEHTLAPMGVEIG